LKWLKWLDNSHRAFYFQQMQARSANNIITVKKEKKTRKKDGLDSVTDLFLLFLF